MSTKGAKVIKEKNTGGGGGPKKEQTEGRQRKKKQMQSLLKKCFARGGKWKKSFEWVWSLGRGYESFRGNSANEPKGTRQALKHVRL